MAADALSLIVQSREWMASCGVVALTTKTDAGTEIHDRDAMARASLVTYHPLCFRITLVGEMSIMLEASSYIDVASPLP